MENESWCGRGSGHVPRSHVGPGCANDADAPAKDANTTARGIHLLMVVTAGARLPRAKYRGVHKETICQQKPASHPPSCFISGDGKRNYACAAVWCIYNVTEFAFAAGWPNEPIGPNCSGARRRSLSCKLKTDPVYGYGHIWGAVELVSDLPPEGETN